MAQVDDAAKQRYARELAAYTLEQWNIARAKQLAREKEGKAQAKSQSKRDTLPPTSPPSKDDITAPANKAVDYNLRTVPKQNGEA